VSGSTPVAGRLVLGDRVAPGRVSVEAGRIEVIELDERETGGPLVAPGFIDVHVHGWGGHDAMGDEAALDGMARALLRHGVTGFLPTAVTAPLADLGAFAERVRDWTPRAPNDGAEPLGFNLEGPFISAARAGAQDAASIVAPAAVQLAELEPLLAGLCLVTVAPETNGAVELIAWLARHGVVVACGHSAATLAEGRAGYGAGARSTTHLFNAMTGLDHRAPGLAAAALADDDVYVELIADGEHVNPALWPIVVRTKPRDRLVLVSDAIALAGTGDGRGRLGGLDVEVRGGRCTLVGSDVLAGSTIGLHDAVRNLVRSGVPLPSAVAAASRNPADLLGLPDRGRIEAGARADLVELGDDLSIRRAMRAGRWVSPAPR
jgi:N-acetylglucosamine-6-phosphate deacetylase